MIIRRLNEKDVIQHEQTASLSFVYSFNEETDAVWEDKFFIGAFADDNKTLAANMEIEDFDLSFCGQTVRCAGIGAVCTRPECRRMGSVRQLFDAFFEEESYDVSVLYPFSTQFYRKFGYVNAGHFVELRMPFSSISFVPRAFSVALYDGSQAESLYAFHNQWAMQGHLTFLRNSDRYFSAKPYETLQYTYLGLDAAGVVNGYVTFRCNRSESTVFVSELAFADKAALFNLLAFLRTYDGNFKTLVIDHLPLWSPMFRILPNTAKDLTRTLRDMGSVRILQLEKLLSMHTYPKESGRFSLYADDCIERNRGIFDVSYADGKAVVSRRNEGDYDIRLDAGALSELVLLGLDCDYSELCYREGFTVCHENPDLLRAFPLKRTYFTDGF